jgi:hypothetical protein
MIVGYQPWTRPMDILNQAISHPNYLAGIEAFTRRAEVALETQGFAAEDRDYLLFYLMESPSIEEVYALTVQGAHESYLGHPESYTTETMARLLRSDLESAPNEITYQGADSLVIEPLRKKFPDAPWEEDY